MSRIIKLLEWLLRLPVLWGGVAGLSFYAALNQGWINSPLLKQYMAGHRVEYVIGMMFFIGLAALAIRFFEVVGQFATIENITLGLKPIGGLPVSACDELISKCSTSCLPRCRRTSSLAASAKRSKWSAAKTRPTRSNSICAIWKS